MKTLAIDTSLTAGSVAAVERSAEVLRTVTRPLGPAGEHARRLMPELAAAAAALGWRIADVDLVAVVRGPGSFTGLRVGVTTAKAVCWATGARLLGVSGFEVVALESAAATGVMAPVAIAFDAGRGDVSTAMAFPDAAAPSGWSFESGGLLPAGRWLESLPSGTRVAGPALETLATEATDLGLMVVPREAWFPSARGAADVAAAHAAAGGSDDPQSLVPEYSRPSYAEEKPPASAG